MGDLAKSLIQSLRGGRGIRALRRDRGFECLPRRQLAIGHELDGDLDLRRRLRIKRQFESANVQQNLNIGGKSFERLGDFGKTRTLETLRHLLLHEFENAVAPLPLRVCFLTVPRSMVLDAA